jgi:exosortase A-associated hydrolase 2
MRPLTAPPQPFFLEAGAGRRGRRFCLFHSPHPQRARGIVVQVHALAEEMNKCRRMAALQSRAFAPRGLAVVQIDLTGCGDSSGDFGDASWEAWIADVRLAVDWARERIDAPLWLWGIRAGALVAGDVAARLDHGCNFVFWQPAVSGHPVLQQLLRLKAAATLGDGRMKEIVEAARARLAGGESVEIAGYLLAGRLAEALKGARLGVPSRPGTVAWLESTPQPDRWFGPATSTAIGDWTAAGHDVRAQMVVGPSFWQSAEIETSPALIAASTAAVAGEALA